MFVLIKKVFIILLTGLVDGSNHTKCVSLRKQKCDIYHINTSMYIQMNAVTNFTTIHLQLD